MDLKIISLMFISFISLYLVVFFLLVWFQGRKELKKDPKPKVYPALTAIIPAFNEEKSIKQCIESLLALDYPGKIKIIVVNDGSTDNTSKIARSYEKQGVLVIDKKNGGKASAMNVGLTHTTTPLVACLDADSRVTPHALTCMVGYFAKEEIAAVTPALKVAKPKSIIQQVQWVEYIVNILQRKLYSLLDIIYVTPGPFSVYRTNVLNEIGKFDEDNMTEDMEIALRIQDRGYSIENSVSAEVFTIAPMTLYSLFGQRVRWYRGLLHNMKLYKHLFFSKKHGLLGMFLFPITVLSIIVSMAGVWLMLSYLLEGVWSALHQVFYMATIGFNITFVNTLTYLIFSQNMFMLLLTWTVLLTSGVVIYYSHKVSSEAISKHMKLGYAAYVFVFCVLLATVWGASIITELFGMRRKWR